MSDKVRVAMLDPSNFSPSYDHWLCEALTQRGAEVTLYGSPLSWPYERAYRFEPIFYPLATKYNEKLSPRSRKIVKGLEHIGGSFARTKQIFEFKPDVIHFQWTPLPEFDHRWMRSMARHGTPIAYTAHNILPHDSPASAARLYGKIYSIPNGMIVHHHDQVPSMQRLFGVDPDRLHVIPIGHFGQVSRFRGAGEVPSWLKERTAGKPTALFFGNILPYKGLDLLLDALAKAAQRIPQLRLIIAGRPLESWETYARQIDDLGLGERVCLWHEFIQEESIADLFDLAQVVAVPYRRIDQSAVALTALGLGKAIVGTEVGGFHEIVKNGANGYLTPVGDAEALAGAMVECFSEPGRAEKMGQASLEIARKENEWDPIAEKTLRVYDRLIHGQR